MRNDLCNSRMTEQRNRLVSVLKNAIVQKQKVPFRKNFEPGILQGVTLWSNIQVSGIDTSKTKDMYVEKNMDKNFDLIVESNFQEISFSHNEDQFLKQKEKLEEFSKKLPSKIELPHASNASWLSWFRDRVTSEDVNNLAKSIQSGMIQQNQYILNIIKEFRVVYDTFSKLDEVYIKEIVNSFNAAVSAHAKANRNILRLNEQQKEIEKDQRDIGGIVKSLEKIVTVLKDFKEKLEKVRHLVDVDSIFANVEENQRQLNNAFQLVDKQKNYIEQLSQELNAKIVQSDQTHSRSLAELKSNVEENTRRNETLVSKLHDDVKQLREEMNQKIHATLSDACAASQTITWN